MAAARDSEYMARAIRLATRGINSCSPNPRVGCVIVADDRIVGEGWHRKAGEPHAEIIALRLAGEKARDATVFVTLEPCSHQGRTGPCCVALAEAGVARIVIAQSDPNPQVDGAGIAYCEKAGIDVETGLLADQASDLNPGFNKRMRHGLPYLRCKIASSVDGRTAMADGESQWITGESARADVHRWRARSCAILTGSGTVLNDDPSLNQRLENDGRQPLRVVVDGELRVSPQSKCFTLPGPRLLVTTRQNIGRAGKYEDCGIPVLGVASDQGGHCDLHELMQVLAMREINEILVEAGSGLNGALLDQGLIDELIVYQAPAILGGNGMGMFAPGKITSMAQKVVLERIDSRFVGDDLRQRFRVI